MREVPRHPPARSRDGHLFCHPPAQAAPGLITRAPGHQERGPRRSQPPLTGGPPPVGGRGSCPGGRGTGPAQTSDGKEGTPARWHDSSAWISRATSAWRSRSPTSTGSAGPARQEILAATGVSPDLRAKDVSDEQVVLLRDYIDANLKVEGDLRREVAQDIRRKIEIQCYQGIRHRRGLPVHGQRTHTNARTRKGPKKTVAGKKKVGKK